MTDSSPFTPAPPFEKSHTQIPDLSKDYINEKKKKKNHACYAMDDANCKTHVQLQKSMKNPA